MTAIYGLWRHDQGGGGSEFARMGGALARFGRDARDAWECGGIAFGRALAAMLPEDLEMFDIHVRGRRYAVVADVHLTERDTLIEQLGLDPVAPDLSDAALIALAIELWNEDAFAKIYGAFAIAAWDFDGQRLILARDHIGQRPLFYHRTPERVAFASMPEGINALSDVEIAADVEQYGRLMRQLPLSPGRTPQAGVARVMPGYYVVIHDNAIQSIRWWKPDLTPLRLPRQREYEVRLRTLLESSVAAALRGSGRVVGAHLSAGFDSSTVVAIAARQLKASDGSIVAFTAVPRPGAVAHVMKQHLVDEGDLAAKTAAMYPNVEHVRIMPEQGSLAALDRTSTIYPIPVGNLCNLTWNDAINDTARGRGLRIMLQGGMGNISISEPGVLALPELIRAGKLRTWFQISRGLVRNGWMQWRGVFWNSFSRYAPSGVWHWMETRSGRPPTERKRYSLLRGADYDALLTKAKRDDVAADRYDIVDYDEFDRTRMSSLDGRLSLLTLDVGAQDKAQLGEWGLDNRDPTADRRLLEFALTVPVERLIWRGEPRAILRKAMAGLLPAAVLDNKRKGYQSADWHEALSRSRADLLAEIDRIEMYDPASALIDVERLRRLVATMPEAGSDRWRDYDTEIDYRYALLRTISTISHMRRTARSNY